MKRLLVSLITIVCVRLTAALEPQPPVDPIPASCVPFDPSLGGARTIDHVCGLQGALTGTNGDKAQDRVKNNLCAWQDASPATITRFTFDQLQANTPSK